MNRINSTYGPSTSNATFSGTLVGTNSTGKAQRERFAEHSFYHSPSSGKERDEETGFGYFGARYYDSELLTGWMSVDPMSDKYPSISPYNYCANNPVKLVDPDGNDWYQNKLTGAIYFNSEYKGSDDVGKGKMKDEGWMHLGGNDMFMNGRYDLKNRGLNIAGRLGDIIEKPNNPIDFRGKSGTHYSGELMLRGKNAESFMNSYGYKKKPLETIAKVKEVWYNVPDEMGGRPRMLKGAESYIDETIQSYSYVKDPPLFPRCIVKKTCDRTDTYTALRQCSTRTELRVYDYSRRDISPIVGSVGNLICNFLSVIL